MLFKQLFTSIAFTRLASFLKENLPPAVTFYLVRNMKAHHDLQSAPQITCNRRLEGFFQFCGGMLSFPGNPQLSSQKNRICHSCPIERGLKLLSTSNMGWEYTLCCLNFSKAQCLSANTGICREISHLSFSPWHKWEGKWLKVTSAT